MIVFLDVFKNHLTTQYRVNFIMGTDDKFDFSIEFHVFEAKTW